MSVIAPQIRPDRALLGIALIVGSVFLMSLQDAIIKYASVDLPLWQIYVLRGAIAVPALLVVVAARRVRSLPFAQLVRRSLGPWVLARALLLVAMYVALYAAVPVLDLAMIAAAFYTGPLFITLLSALLLDEPVGRRGWLAVATGFAGVLAILRPGTAAFSGLAILPVLAGLFYALAAIITRSRCRSDPPLVLALSLNLALLATGLAASLALAVWSPGSDLIAVSPFLMGGWVGVGGAEWGFMMALAALIVGIAIGLAAAYQAAPPVTVATFDYSYLIFATIWGYAIFSQVPDPPTILGMMLIAGGGLLVIRR
jgi:drug/metabolite transporter (DMT)-like permease